MDILSLKKYLLDKEYIENNDEGDENINGMNIPEVLKDISIVIDKDINSLILHLQKIKMWHGLFISIPKHCNLYYLIVNVYNKTIPKWFADKYSEVDIDDWISHIEDYKIDETFHKDETNISLGDRMKQYELDAISISNIPSNKSYIVRLDGHSFSKFTLPLKKPFDIIFIKAMALTVQDLLEKFHANTGYTHSDEITLIFNKVESEQSTHLFNGRASKLLSLMASYCSVRFNYHLKENIETIKDEYPCKFIKKIQKCEQIFDARILIIEPSEIVNHQIWRSVRDCHRNAVSTYAGTVFSHKIIDRKNTAEKIDMLKSKNIIWDNIPTFVKYGLYCKKILYEYEVNGEKCVRSRYEFKNFKINHTIENINKLTDKYWDKNDIYGESINISSLNQSILH